MCVAGGDGGGLKQFAINDMIWILKKYNNYVVIDEMSIFGWMVHIRNKQKYTMRKINLLNDPFSI